jgi:hypothetical protein
MGNNISFYAGIMAREFGSLFVKGMKPISNEDINRCFFVVYFTGDVLAFSAGFDFFVAFDLADLVAI